MFLTSSRKEIYYKFQKSLTEVSFFDGNWYTPGPCVSIMQGTCVSTISSIQISCISDINFQNNCRNYLCACQEETTPMAHYKVKSALLCRGATPNSLKVYLRPWAQRLVPEVVRDPRQAFCMSASTLRRAGSDPARERILNSGKFWFRYKLERGTQPNQR